MSEDNSGTNCDSKSFIPSYEVVTDFVKSLTIIKDLPLGILDFLERIYKTISSHFQLRSDINTYLETCQSIHTIDKLKENLLTVQDTLSRFIYKLNALFCFVENDDTIPSVITALGANNFDPLKAFLRRVKLSINEVVEGFQEFSEVYEPLEDSIKNECRRCVEYLNKVNLKKREISSSASYWKCALGAAALGLASFGLTALTGMVTCGLAPGLLIAFGCFSITGLGIYIHICNDSAHSEFPPLECQLKEMYTELTQISDASLTLQKKGRKYYSKIKDCLTRVDTLLRACEDQGQVKTERMLNDIADMIKKLQSLKTDQECN